MAERRPTNSELRLKRLTAQEPDREQRGILELFDDGGEELSDEDAPLARETDEHDG
ncbi:MAG TPA: hypothetical protein VKR79_12455 [Gaiellaceae bacterium]|nr:hypothetical protein [Gaiellaceae bacterium]